MCLGFRYLPLCTCVVSRPSVFHIPVFGWLASRALVRRFPVGRFRRPTPGNLDDQRCACVLAGSCVNIPRGGELRKENLAAMLADLLAGRQASKSASQKYCLRGTRKTR
jgi:hypothetical protein